MVAGKLREGLFSNAGSDLPSAANISSADGGELILLRKGRKIIYKDWRKQVSITAVGFSSLILAVKLCLLWQSDASAPHSHPSWLFPSRPSTSWPANEMSQISSAHVQRFHVSERTPLGVALESRMRLAHWYLQELFLGYWGGWDNLGRS